GGLTVRGHVSLPSEAKGPGAPSMTVRLTTFRPDSSETNRTFFGNVASDGSFEVSNVVPARYSVAFIPDIFPGNIINVSEDIDDLEIAVPASILRATVEATVKLEGNAPMPPVGISLKNENPEAFSEAFSWMFSDDKISILGISIGEYSLKVIGLPEGYAIKSFTAGDTDLLTENLKHTYINRHKIELTLGVTTPNPGVPVKGVLTGKDREILPLAINLSGVTPGLTLNARIQQDGSFQLPMVPPGTYNVEFTTPIDATPVKRTIIVGTNPTTAEVPVRIAGLARVTVKVNTGQVNASNGRDVQWGRDFPYLQAEGSRDNSTATRARIASDGNIEFLNVAPGRYRVFMATQQLLSGPPTVVSSGPGITITVTDKDVTVDLSVK
ncbi:MAG TPA: hypothetical protein VFO86_06710, partial [Terriglobia bacterium]|nr:hypothetical protein [Terriglobia bacterium]